MPRYTVIAYFLVKKVAKKHLPGANKDCLTAVMRPTGLLALQAALFLLVKETKHFSHLRLIA